MLLKLLVVVVLGVPVMFVGMGVYSHFKTPVTGLQDGKLQGCPGSPNCVCSESFCKAGAEYIDGLAFKNSSVSRLENAVLSMGGNVIEKTQDYLYTTYSSSLLRFVDDVEFRFDQQTQVWQVRSASRVGHSDLGVNRKRIESLRDYLTQSE